MTPTENLRGRQDLPRSTTLRPLILALASVIALAACSTDPSPSAAPTRPATAAPSVPPDGGTADPTADGGPEARPTTWVVSELGDDGAAGTEDAPFATIERGITAARPGDTVLVREGLYVENIRNPDIASGTPEEPITLAAYPGERPVLEGLLWLTGADHWLIDGINVTWHQGNASHEHMVIITDGVGWELRNSEIWGADSYANLLIAGTEPGEPDDWVVADNCIHETYWGNERNQDHNVYINTGLEAGEGLVEGNLIFEADNGSNIKLGGPESAPDDGSANVTIRGNTLYDAAQPMLLAGGTNNILIERNIIANSVSPWLIRAFRLTGEDNVLRDNLGFQAQDWVFADAEYGSLTDGGGNILPYDPEFNHIGCTGFEPTDRAAREYGA